MLPLAERQKALFAQDTVMVAASLPKEIGYEGIRPDLRQVLEKTDEVIQRIDGWPLRVEWIQMRLFTNVFRLRVSDLSRVFADVRRSGIIKDLLVPDEDLRGRSTKRFDQDRVRAFGALLWVIGERGRQQGETIRWDAAVLQAKEGLAGHPLADLIHYPQDPAADYPLNQKAAMIFTGQIRSDVTPSQEDESTVSKEENLLEKIPNIDERGFRILAMYTLSRVRGLYDGESGSNNAVVFPKRTKYGISQEFLLAQVATFIKAANTCSVEKNDTAMREYDPSLKGLTKGQLKDAYRICWGYLNAYSELVENLAQVFQIVVQKAVSKNFWKQK